MLVRAGNERVAFGLYRRRYIATFGGQYFPINDTLPLFLLANNQLDFTTQKTPAKLHPKTAVQASAILFFQRIKRRPKHPEWTSSGSSLCSCVRAPPATPHTHTQLTCCLQGHLLSATPIMRRHWGLSLTAEGSSWSEWTKEHAEATLCAGNTGRSGTPSRPFVP